MDVGIVGLPGAGKTCLFKALTGVDVSGFSDKPNVGVANVPDPRLGVIAGFITTRKVIPATIRLVDIHGVPPGSDAKKLSGFLEHVRQVDAVCQVVRCFDDGTGTIDAAGDIDRMDTELVLADLVVAESARDKATRTARSGEKEAKDRLAILETVIPALEDGTPIRAIESFSAADRALLRSYGFITAKPVLLVANVGEDDVAGAGEASAAVRARAEAISSACVVLCASLEAELAELEEADRNEMLESLGLAEPAIGPLARGANSILGLTTFYTAGDKEVRAWPIPVGATAPQAAGAVHSDIERGFIRAECYHIDDLVKHHTEKAIKEAGHLRVEGKSYVMQDGDVVHFLFNV